MGIFNKLKDQTVSVSSRIFDWSALSAFSTEKALENSAFWACTMNLARTFASLPLHTYERKPDGSRAVTRSISQAKVLRRPCPYMDTFTFYFVMSLNYELYGAAYAKIERSVLGAPIYFYPIASNLVVPKVSDKGKLSYRYTPTNETIDRKDMLVLMNTTTNGIVPISPLTYAEKDLSTADAAKLIQANYFKRGTLLGGIVKAPRNTTKEQKDEIKTAFMNGFGGSQNAFKVAVMNDGYEYTPIVVNSRQAEFLDAQSGPSLKWPGASACPRHSPVEQPERPMRTASREESISYSTRSSPDRCPGRQGSTMHCSQMTITTT